MLKLIKLEIQKIKRVYITSVIIGVLFSALVIIPYLSGWSYYNNIQIWSTSSQMFCIIYPLFAVIPSCWLLYYERKNHFLDYTQNRVSKKRYLLSKYFVCATGGGLILFIMSIVGLVVCLYIVPKVVPSTVSLENFLEMTFKGEYYVAHPFLYGLFLSLWRFVIGFIIATFSFVLSLYVKNLFIILTLPFIYAIGENFILSVLRLESYRLVVSFYPGAVVPDSITYLKLLIGPLLLLTIIVFTIIYFSRIKKEQIYAI